MSAASGGPVQREVRGRRGQDETEADHDLEWAAEARAGGLHGEDGQCGGHEDRDRDRGHVSPQQERPEHRGVALSEWYQAIQIVEELNCKFYKQI